MDFSRGLVLVNKKEIQLTPAEYDLRKVLVTHAGKVITHRQLLRQVWDEDYDGMYILQVNISNLLGKLGIHSIQTDVHPRRTGSGYRLKV